MAHPSDMVVFDNSMRPSTQRSVVRKFADMLTLGHATPALRSAEQSFGVPHVAAALHSVRASGEAAVTGAALGALSGAGMLDHDGVPMDLASGVLSVIAGVAAARHEIGTTLRTVGHTSIGIFSFRKTEQWLGVRKAAIHGEMGDGEESHEASSRGHFNAYTPNDDMAGINGDPILAAAQAL